MVLRNPNATIMILSRPVCFANVFVIFLSTLMERNILLNLQHQYYVKNLKTLWHTATYAYNSPSRGTLQHLADDIENS